ncbi:hypothetical protein SCP_0406410 [Sparassis crispa]|uniref:Uncharacterized protein n=1 Tax=Sparassis crispa TaxID=139825 RepID=A0A401GJB3_9APHY|nr:hypothetical protein SCP_0406410 [Sparassis crispa]GBE82257.1 hypothetical protein SCP_0406410 [Sparassis crispa]
MARPFSEQDPKTVNRIQQQISQQCPFVKRYQDYWPVKNYINIYLSGCVVRARRKAEMFRLVNDPQLGSNKSKHFTSSRVAVPQAPSTPRKHPRQFIGQTPTKRRLPGSPARKTRTLAITDTVRTRTNERATAAHARGKGEGHLFSRSASQSLTSTFHRTLPRGSQDHHTTVAEASQVGAFNTFFARSPAMNELMHIDDKTRPIWDFLQSLAIPAPHLFAILLADGITSIRILRAIAKMSACRGWVELLVTSGRATMLEAESLWEGLTELAKVQIPARNMICLTSVVEIGYV